MSCYRVDVFRLVLSLYVLLGPTFRGCEGESEPVVLPPAHAEGCLSDDDCPAMACEATACLAGSCVRTGDVADADGDGFGPDLLCGRDCDDQNADVHPGATEMCDGVDEDCDGQIDEGAGGRTQTIAFPSAGLATTALVPWRLGPSNAVLAIYVDSGAAFAVSLDLAGRLGAPVELFRLARGGRFEEVLAGRRDDGTVVVISRTDTGSVSWTTVVQGERQQPETTFHRFVDLAGPADDIDLSVVRSHTVMGAHVRAADRGRQLVVFEDFEAEPLSVAATPDTRVIRVAAFDDGFAVTDGHVAFVRAEADFWLDETRGPFGALTGGPFAVLETRNGFARIDGGVDTPLIRVDGDRVRRGTQRWYVSRAGQIGVFDDLAAGPLFVTTGLAEAVEFSGTPGLIVWGGSQMMLLDADCTAD